MLFPDIAALVRELKAQDSPGAFFYRGQMSRSPVHVWHDHAGRRVEIEALYPSDFRFFRGYGGWDPMLHQQVRAARESGEKTRNRFSRFLIDRATGSHPGFEWLRHQWLAVLLLLKRLELQDPSLYRILREASEPTDADVARAVGIMGGAPSDLPCYRLLWSLAQHYLVATALLDVTRSVDVAAWFATQPWSTDTPPPRTGTGVVYRFHRSRLRELLEKHSRTARKRALDEGRPPFHGWFIIDLTLIPPGFALRPTNQHGASLLGFDRPTIVYEAFESGVVEAFQFRHRSYLPELTVTRDAIMPEDDPFLAVLADFRSRNVAQ